MFGYPGLYVLDGALLPGPVGANPSLTIAAVADRGCTHILERLAGRRRTSSLAGPGRARGQAVRDPMTGPARAGERRQRHPFTEQMKGFVALGGPRPGVRPAAGKATATG